MKVREFKLTNLAIDNKTTIYFFTVILIVIGISSFKSTPKESFPEVVFPYFAISSIYPGTSPSDMENLVTRPIEKELRGINGIKTLSSKSLQDFSMIFIEFETNIDIDEAYNDVKEAVDKSKPNLPTDLLDDPEVTKIDVSEFPIININMSGDLSLVTIKEYADDLKDEIESLEEITRVDIVGALDREIQIHVDLYKMQSLGMSFQEIQDKVAMENMTISSGKIDMDGLSRTVRIVGEFNNIDDIRNIVLRDGIRLKDVADVQDDYAERESYARLNQEDVITLNVIRRSGKNLLEAIDKINVIIDKFQEKTPSNLKITTTGDQSEMTRNNLNDLFNTIIIGFMIVVLVLMFFMGVDNALFVAVAIPLSILIAFILIPAVGFTLNMVVLVSFILVLGIVVDNSIVVVENIYRHYTTTPNLSITRASKIGAGEVAGPVFSGTLTTMAPFIPLAFWPGIMGEFMQYIPVTLILTLTASMLVAYVMNPVFAVSFMKYRADKKYKVNKKELIWVVGIGVVLTALFFLTGVIALANIIIFILLMYLGTKIVVIPLIRKFQANAIPWMMNIYKNQVSYFIKGKNSIFVFGGTIVLLIFTFFLMAVKPPQVVLFPSGDPNTMYVYVSMPAGTDVDYTDSITSVVENKVYDVIGRDNPDVESVISNVAIGAGQNAFENTQQPKLGKVTINFVEYKYREGISTSVYLDSLRANVKDIPGAQIVVDKEQMGPPVGKPINIEISGEELPKLIEIQDRLLAHIEESGIQGIEELKSDMEVSTPEAIIKIDRAKATKLGISTAYIGATIRTALYGSEISKYREGEDEYPIQVRLKKKYRDNINALLNMKLAVPGGQNGVRFIPISAVADVEYTSSYGGIIRKDYDRVITLSSNVLAGYNANEIVQALQKSLANFDLEEGYKIEFTGEQQEQAETGAFLMNALLIAIALIFLILITQFNSISKTLIISSQMIFSFIGVLLGTIFTGMDISIVMTGMGIIAVAGIVVKNAIILIDYTDVIIKQGGNVRDAIVQAGATRLTPVLLTAASTILGLLPLAVGMNINFYTLFTDYNPNIFFGGDMAAFWKPLSWTIIFGLTFATFLTLILVPAMYLIAYKIKERTGRLKPVEVSE